MLSLGSGGSLSNDVTLRINADASGWEDTMSRMAAHSKRFRSEARGTVIDAEYTVRNAAKARASAESTIRSFSISSGAISKGIGLIFNGLKAGIVVFSQLSMAALGLGVQITRTLTPAFVAVEDWNLRVIRSASVLASIYANSGDDISKTYQQAHTYAEALQTTLIKINKNTLANVAQMNLVNLELNKQGIQVDINTEKSVKGFETLTNAIAVMTAGMQNQNMQFGQEIRAVLEGNIRQGSTLALFLKQKLGPETKKIIEEWKRSGTFLENISKHLKGFNAASHLIQRTWTSIYSTFMSYGEYIAAKAFTPLYDFVIDIGLALNKYIANNLDNIINNLHNFVSTFVSFLEKIKNSDVLKSVVEFGKTFYTAGQIFLTEIKPVLDTLITVLEKTANIVLSLVTAMLKLYQYSATKRYQENLLSYQSSKSTFEEKYGMSYEDALKNKPEDIELMREYNKSGKANAFSKDMLKRVAVNLRLLEQTQDAIYGYEKAMNLSPTTVKGMNEATKSNNTNRGRIFTTPSLGPRDMYQGGFRGDLTGNPKYAEFKKELEDSNNMLLQLQNTLLEIEISFATFAENVAAMFKGVYESLYGFLEKSLASGIKNLWDQSKSLTDVVQGLWKSMFDAIADEIAKFLAKEAVKFFLKFLFDFFAPGSSSVVNVADTFYSDKPGLKIDATSGYNKKYGIGTPTYDVGTNFVPEDQLAYIHKGEMIIPSKEAKEYREEGMFGNLEAKLDALISVTAQNKYAIVDESGLASMTRAINRKNFEFGRYGLA